MHTRLLGYGSLIFCFFLQTAQAQMPGLTQPGLNSSLIKLFGKINAFSSKTQVRMLDKTQKETMSMTMDFAFLDGKIRLDVDLNQIKSTDIPQQMLGSLKQIGMDKMVSIVRPDKKATLVIYPALKAYAEIPMSREEAADLEKNFKIEKSPLGKEIVDGHPCQKNKVNVTDGKGGRQEAVVWNATDMKDFPLVMQMNQPDATVEMHYRQVQIAPPEAARFEVPPGFAKHDSIDKLMQGAMMKMLGGK